MRLLCAGLNWKTPVWLRERLVLDTAKQAASTATWRERFPGRELAILTTCNRTELYAAQGEGIETLDNLDLAEFLADVQSARVSDFLDYLYFHEEATAARHLFRVAAGLDSLVIGESQILGQVREAYRAATASGTIGQALHALFQAAIAAAKRVHAETELSKGRLSIASAAVDHIRAVFETFSDKTVLVIGGGKMAELTLTHLAEYQPKTILVVNRGADRASDLAARFGGRPWPFEELTGALVQADIVVSSTGSAEPIVRAADFAEIMRARQNRLLAIIDIAVPRDFEPAIGAMDNVVLSNIDDLEKIRDRTLHSRRQELDKAQKIVDGELAGFLTRMAVRESGPMIGRLEREFERIMEQELDWLLPQLNGIPDAHREKIRHFAHRLKNKFLHQPKAALREQEPAGGQHTITDAFRRLFGLDRDR